MKFISFFIVPIIVLFCSIAFAYDMTYASSVRPHDSKRINIEVPQGHALINVWPLSNSEKISCLFIDPGTDEIALQIDNVPECAGQTHLDLPSNLIVKIVNNGNRDLQVRVWVRSVKD